VVGGLPADLTQQQPHRTPLPSRVDVAELGPARAVVVGLTGPQDTITISVGDGLVANAITESDTILLRMTISGRSLVSSLHAVT